MLRVQLGAGEMTRSWSEEQAEIFRRPGWVHLGGPQHRGRPPEREAELRSQVDFHEWYWNRVDCKLPFVDRSVHFVYSEHFLEHLSWVEGGLLMEEVARVLAPGGVVRTAVPDHVLCPDPPRRGDPKKHKMRYSVHSLGELLYCAGLEPVPRLWWDQDGTRHDLIWCERHPTISPQWATAMLAYGGDAADNEMVHACVRDMVRRRAVSLVVDGVKR